MNSHVRTFLEYPYLEMLSFVETDEFVDKKTPLWEWPQNIISNIK